MIKSEAYTNYKEELNIATTEMTKPCNMQTIAGNLKMTISLSLVMKIINIELAIKWDHWTMTLETL